jgi:branched-chain amino acid transport system permease protein
LGVILGAPTLRLRGDYLAIVTLAFGEIVPRIFENATSGIFGIGNIDFSNGRQGITPIDKVNFPWTDEKFKYPLELNDRCRAGDGPAGHLLQSPAAARGWVRVDRGAREGSPLPVGVGIVRARLGRTLGAALGRFAGVFWLH